MKHLAPVASATVLMACAAAQAPPPPQEVPAPAAPAGPTASPEVEALVDAVTAAYGGPAAVARLGACRVTGTIESLIRNEGGPGSLRRDFQGPDRLRVAIAYPNSTELRLLNGSMGWRGSLFGVTPAQGPPYEAMRYQLFRVQPAWILTRYRDQLRRVPSAPGSSDAVLELTASQVLTLRYTVRAADHRIARVDASLRFPPAELRFATDYGDFRQVDGAWVAFLEETHANGRHTGTTRLREVELGREGLGPFDP